MKLTGNAGSDLIAERDRLRAHSSRLVDRGVDPNGELLTGMLRRYHQLCRMVGYPADAR